MSTANVILGWLKDKDKNKIAPKTLSSQVMYDNELGVRPYFMIKND